jgi:hypothetical protein
MTFEFGTSRKWTCHLIKIYVNVLVLLRKTIVSDFNTFCLRQTQVLCFHKSVCLSMTYALFSTHAILKRPSHLTVVASCFIFESTRVEFPARRTAFWGFPWVPHTLQGNSGIVGSILNQVITVSFPILSNSSFINHYDLLTVSFNKPQTAVSKHVLVDGHALELTFTSCTNLHVRSATSREKLFKLDLSTKQRRDYFKFTILLNKRKTPAVISGDVCSLSSNTKHKTKGMRASTGHIIRSPQPPIMRSLLRSFKEPWHICIRCCYSDQKH